MKKGVHIGNTAGQLRKWTKVNYKEAKKKGFKYITRDIIGGECAHKEVPVRNNGYWYSKGWHYITKNGHECKSKEDIMDIDTAIDPQSN